MKRTLVTSSLLALVSATLISCGGGGSDGITTTAPSSATPAVATSGSTSVSALSAASMANLSISGSVQGVAINSPPVVTFQLVNSDNNTALADFETLTVQRNKVSGGATVSSGGSTDAVPIYQNFAFSIAKLVPGANGSPSKWVSYMVSAPSLNSDGTVKKDANNNPIYTLERPGSEQNGTLEYLGNGQYKYTFRRDITKVAGQVAAASDTSTNKRADLGNLTYDPNAVHRLVIQVSSVARGSRTGLTLSTETGFSASRSYCHTANGLCPDGFDNTPYEIVRTPVDLVYDWIPATGRVVKATDADVEQREIVNVAACASCHNKFTFHGGNALKGLGGGRQETRQCVVCHTDQRKFGRTGASVWTGVATTSSTYTIDGLSADDNQSLLDFPVMVHKIHMGESLIRPDYNIAGVKAKEVKYPQLITNCAKCHSGDVTKPDGTANTIAKLDGTVVQMATAQGNNWNTKPNRQACGACHDGINFNTGAGTKLDGHATGHGAGGIGGAQANDSQCGTCHTPDAIKGSHVAVTPPNRNSTLFSDCKAYNTVTGTCNGNANVAWIASNLNNLPTGAIKVSYDIKSVVRVAGSSTGPCPTNSFCPQMVFRILQNGQRVDFNTFQATVGGAAVANCTGLTSGTYPLATRLSTDYCQQEMVPNFMGSPSAYFVWAKPQDGIDQPADFNASASGYLRSIWNGKASGTGAGVLSGPDGSGYYTITLTGVTVPDGAVMLSGGLGYSYSPATTLPLTQTNLAAYPVSAATANNNGNSSLNQTSNPHQPNKTGGLIVIAPDASKVASAGKDAGATGGAYTGRRQIVEDARCNNCHQELGAFNEESFHAGQRNDAPTCSWCHTPNRASSGWSADSTNFIHGIHGDIKRKYDFTWHAASTTEGYWKIGYPGVLKNCEACHIPGSYDFSNPASKAAAGLPMGGTSDKRLFRYSATGLITSQASITAPTGQTLSSTELANYQALTAFAYSRDVTQGSTYGSGAATNGALYETPTATVCFACHDDDTTVKSSMGATAKAHMLANGAKLYEARSGNPAQSETCLTSCHAPGSAANIKAVHSK